MWRRVQHLDHRLMKRSFGTRSPALDRTLIAITRAANYSRLWLVIAGALAVFGRGRGRRAAGRGLIAIAIAAGVANGPAKLFARRRRPSSRSHPALIRTPRSTSFPSGHSAAAFAFVTGACAELPVLAPALVPLAGTRCLFARAHRRSLPKRCRGRRGDRDRIGLAGGTLAEACSQARADWCNRACVSPRGHPEISG